MASTDASVSGCKRASACILTGDSDEPQHKRRRLNFYVTNSDSSNSTATSSNSSKSNASNSNKDPISSHNFSDSDSNADDSAQQNSQPSQRRTRSKKSPDSAQSPGARAKLRVKYRNLSESMVADRVEIIDPSSDKFQFYALQQDKLYEQVEHTTEAQLDMEQTAYMSDLLKQQVTKLKNDNFIITSKQLVNAVKMNFYEPGPGVTPPERDSKDVIIDWARLGRMHCGGVESSTRFIKTAPVLERRKHLYDEALELAYELDANELKQKKLQEMKELKEKNEKDINITQKNKKKKWETDEKQVSARAMRPDEAKNGVHANPTQRRIGALNSLLKKTCGKEDNESIGMFDFVVNPESYSETLENVFFLSFLVREGKTLMVPENGEEGNAPTLKFVEEKEKNANNGQCIVKMDFNFYNHLVEGLSIEESKVKRKDKKTGATDVYEEENDWMMLERVWQDEDEMQEPQESREEKLSMAGKSGKREIDDEDSSEE